MTRESALKVVLVMVGCFLPQLPIRRSWACTTRSTLIPATMQMAIYATLGIFLLVASRNPSAHRSLIAFAAWSSFAHAAIMGTLGFEIPELRTGFLITSAILVVIGVALIALAPRKQPVREASASGA